MMAAVGAGPACLAKPVIAMRMLQPADGRSKGLDVALSGNLPLFARCRHIPGQCSGRSNISPKNKRYP